MRTSAIVGVGAAILAASLGVMTGSLLAQERRDVGAHVHGQSVLRIAVEGSKLLWDFDVPGLDLVGFERAPQTAEEKAAVTAATTALQSPLALFDIGTEAGCTVTMTNVEFNVEQDTPAGADAQAARNSATVSQHTGFEAVYEMTCGNIAAITQMRFAYFQKYPAAKEVRLEIASSKGQTTVNVPREAPTLSLAGKL
jgi:hypothetical protein